MQLGRTQLEAGAPTTAERSALAAKRQTCVCTPLGLHPEYFFPRQTGNDYQLSPYLEIVGDFAYEHDDIARNSDFGRTRCSLG